MVETGFFELVQAATGGIKGYSVQLPQNVVSSSVPSAWTTRGILSTPLYELDGQNSFTKWEVQIDCHGFGMANALTLARTINTALSGGWHGTLSDGTVVTGIYRLPGQVDGYADANKTFVRSLEYVVHYYEQ